MSAGLGLRPFAQKGLCPSGAALRTEGYPEPSAYAEVRSSIGHRGHAAAATARPGTTVGRPRREVGRSRGWPRGEPACRVRVVLFVFPGLPSTPGLLGVTRCRARSGRVRHAVAVPGLRQPGLLCTARHRGAGNDRPRLLRRHTSASHSANSRRAPVTRLEDASHTDHR
jgi:hypothetical protein